MTTSLLPLSRPIRVGLKIILATASLSFLLFFLSNCSSLLQRGSGEGGWREMESEIERERVKRKIPAVQELPEPSLGLHELDDVGAVGHDVTHHEVAPGLEPGLPHSTYLKVKF
jgi:hypothetical protein